MEEVISASIQWAVPAVLGGILGWVLNLLRKTKKSIKEKGDAEDARLDAMCEGIRSLLRAELIRLHEKFIDCDAPMGVADFEYLERTYAAYHRLGGNGTGTELYNACVAKFHGKEY